MGDSTLYDDDILLWSEQQAEAIRRLRETAHNLPNDLDIENVAEEIESVGRSELAAVKSYLRLILAHLIKLYSEDESAVTYHWQSEIMAFHDGLRDRYAPSMYQRIDLRALWRSERERMIVAAGPGNGERVRALPAVCPLTLDDLIQDEIATPALAERLRASVTRA